MKRNVIIAVAAAAAVIGGGTLAGAALGSNEDPTGGSGRAEESSSAIAPAADDADGEGDDGDDDGSPAPGAGSAFERATETATTAVPGVVTGVEFDRNDAGGRAAWEIGLRGEDGRWHQVWVSQDGAEVLDSRADDDQDDDADDQDEVDAAERLLNDDGLPIAEAIRLAEDHTSAAFREAELDDGRWHVELRGDDGTEYELEIDLTTGEIASEEEEQDSDRNDADDGHDGDDVHDRDDVHDD